MLLAKGMASTSHLCHSIDTVRFVSEARVALRLVDALETMGVLAKGADRLSVEKVRTLGGL